AMGATLAQGWYFGRPGPLTGTVPNAGSPVRRGGPRARGGPAAPPAAPRQPTIGRKDVLLSITRALEAQALELGGHAVIASTFQHRRHFTERSRSRYAQLAQ